MTRPGAATGTGRRRLDGWGRATSSHATVTGPLTAEAAAELLASRPPRGVLARGSGCSYGDAAQNAGGVVLLPDPDAGIRVDHARGTVRAAAGATFRQLLHATVPLGLLPPVLPGTARLTLGGAVAADVHGKNHRRDGSIGAWLDSVQLLCPDGTLHDIGPAREPGLFRATVGGMGLTGVVLAAELRLLRIASARLRVTTRRAGSLDEVLELLDSAPGRYTVAWIDTTSAGGGLGRGVVDSADHLEHPDPRREPRARSNVPRAPAG
ncbi:FAD-binding protein [Streptacidiphilus monticola]